MRMIIIGASGMMGSVLLEEARKAGKEVIGTYHSHQGATGLLGYDMRKGNLGKIVPRIGPQDSVYILSAYSNPSWIYANQEEARSLNLDGTKRLIDEIAQTGARIIFMSSVEVFDGEHGNYTEQSMPHPINLYGRMKLEIEEYLLAKKCNSCIVRTCWNVGWDFESRCVIKLTYLTLMAPGARMARDNVFSIIDVRDTAEGLLRLFERPDVTVCHFASSPGVVRTDLASMIMNLSKYKELMSYETVLLKDIPYSEKRSRNNQMDNSFAVSSLGMKFRPPEDIIRQKVQLLDLYHEKNYGSHL